jgi:large subunit ribosomal protein L23Ae
LRPSKSPKYSRHAIQKHDTWDHLTILKQPVQSERFFKKMETENKVIFFVDPKANKIEIKRAFNASFKIIPEKVNILRTPDGRKKAYIKIPKAHEATEIANKIGLI